MRSQPSVVCRPLTLSRGIHVKSSTWTSILSWLAFLDRRASTKTFFSLFRVVYSDLVQRHSRLYLPQFRAESTAGRSIDVHATMKPSAMPSVQLTSSAFFAMLRWTTATINRGRNISGTLRWYTHTRSPPIIMWSTQAIPCDMKPMMSHLQVCVQWKMNGENWSTYNSSLLLTRGSIYVSWFLCVSDSSLSSSAYSTWKKENESGSSFYINSMCGKSISIHLFMLQL